MKKFIYLFLPLIVAALIFCIPFFWLKPGEMDLGGDNSRLYFYDPIAYLISQSLYSVSHSAFGAENLSYFGIPFFLLLAGVKSFVHSPTTLISIFHGLNMSLGFISCYLIVKELVKRDEKTDGESWVIGAAGMLAGLFYLFSTIPIAWWSYPILPMNQVFLNPLLFFLLLRFFLTSHMRYLYAVLLFTFFFSPNFSFIGAPSFFAFFPFACLNILFYTKYVKKRTVPVVKVIVGLVLFILLQIYHLLPQTLSILTPGSAANETVFGTLGKYENGLNYFLATAPMIKVSNSLFGLQQFGKPAFYFPLYIIFPLLIVLGLLWNKGRTYLLSAIFFFIPFFFFTANITALGFKLYSLAFRLPGFSMFRVFYGQWQWSYIFFYSILIGLALAIVLGRLKTVQRYLLTGFIGILLITTAWPLITGKLTDTTLWQSKNISSHVQMDPQYEETLSYIRNLPVDGKILSLPLNDHGYQVVKGKNDAAYEGPSTITYLAARNEFTSTAELGVFGTSLLTAARAGNYPVIRNILSMLNIKYIFYNDDPYIYLRNFPALPYTEVRNFLPDSQEGYRDFIKNLGAKEIKSIAGKYHIYAFEDSSYIPHIYAADNVVYWNDAIVTNVHTPLSFYPEGGRVALYDDAKIVAKNRSMFDGVILTARNTSPIFDFFEKKKEDKFVSPTISRQLYSSIYPFVVLKEKMDLSRYKTVNDAYIDRSIYFAEKRINELTILEHIPLRKNIDSITTFGNTWTEPKLWDFTKYGDYNSWEVTLVRYQKSIERIINDLEKANQSDYSTIISKVELKSYLRKHKEDLRAAIRKETLWSTEDRMYISSLVERMFADIYVKLNLHVPDVTNIPYTVDFPLEGGAYEVYVNKQDVANLNVALNIDGVKLAPKVSDESDWMRFNDISVPNKRSSPIILSIANLPNLVDQSQWSTAELITTKDPVILNIPYDFLNDTSGLVRDISGWEENTIYAISFDYLTYDQNFSMAIYEMGGSRTNIYSQELYEETFRSKEWKNFSTAILSSKNAQSAFLHIVKAQDDYKDVSSNQTKKLEVKNFSIQKISNPRIVFKKILKPTGTSNPQITFTKINPTKYKVVVHNAKEPYALVLSQSFNQKWKLFFLSPGYEAKSLKGASSRLIGILLKILTKPFINVSSPDDLRVTASYAGGSIQEGVHKSSLLDAHTFETWGQDPIAEATHLPVNGYANSWYIEPKDVQNQNDYTLIIEMTSQKLFYGSVFLTVGGLLLVIFLFIRSFLVIRK